MKNTEKLYKNAEGEVVRIINSYEVKSYPDEEHSPVRTIVEYMLDFKDIPIGKVHTVYKEDFLKSFKSIARKAHCYKCGKKLNAETMKICGTCGGIICPDDQACLCGYTVPSSDREWT